MHPDPRRPVIMSDSDPRVSIPVGKPTGIPVVSRGNPDSCSALKHSQKGERQARANFITLSDLEIKALNAYVYTTT